MSVVSSIVLSVGEQIFACFSQKVSKPQSKLSRRLGDGGGLLCFLGILLFFYPFTAFIGCLHVFSFPVLNPILSQMQDGGLILTAIGLILCWLSDAAEAA